MALVFHNAALEALCVGGDYRVDQVPSIAAVLQEHGALSFAPLGTGLYPASSAADLGASGYGRVWVRDNVYVALALMESGRPQAGRGGGHGVDGVLSQAPAPPGRVALRGHSARAREPAPCQIRWRIARGDQRGSVASPQNDALGYCLWLYARLGRQEEIELGNGDFDTLALLANYLCALRFWDDEDSGHWEETRKRSPSSIGTVVPGLQEWTALLEERSDRATVGVSRAALIDTAVHPDGAPGPAGGLRSARGGDPSTTVSARKSARCGGRTPANPPAEGLITDAPLTIDPFIPTIVSTRTNDSHSGPAIRSSRSQ